MVNPKGDHVPTFPTRYGSSGGTECAPNCELPPSCGDGLLQPEFGERCDNGVENDGRYGGCTAACQLAAWCGDALVFEGLEECDDGANDGTYGNCAPGCLLGWLLPRRR